MHSDLSRSIRCRYQSFTHCLCRFLDKWYIHVFALNLYIVCLCSVSNVVSIPTLVSFFLLIHLFSDCLVLQLWMLRVPGAAFSGGSSIYLLISCSLLLGFTGFGSSFHFFLLGLVVYYYFFPFLRKVWVRVYSVTKLK